MKRRVLPLFLLCLTLMSCAESPADTPPETLAAPMATQTLEVFLEETPGYVEATTQKTEGTAPEHLEDWQEYLHYRIEIVMQNILNSTNEWRESGYMVPIIRVVPRSGWDIPNEEESKFLRRITSKIGSWQFEFFKTEYSSGYEPPFISIMYHSPRYISIQQIVSFNGGRRVLNHVRYLTVDMQTGEIVAIEDLLDIHNENFLKEL